MPVPKLTAPAAAVAAEQFEAGGPTFHLHSNTSGGSSSATVGIVAGPAPPYSVQRSLNDITQCVKRIEDTVTQLHALWMTMIEMGDLRFPQQQISAPAAANGDGQLQ